MKIPEGIPPVGRSSETDPVRRDRLTQGEQDPQKTAKEARLARLREELEAITGKDGILSAEDQARESELRAEITQLIEELGS